uniref:Uncharacterized protein n=1 Tax=Anguilla anguilla TaxID=7936 RepID=A0A0E9TX49_ANGAN
MEQRCKLFFEALVVLLFLGQLLGES